MRRLLTYIGLNILVSALVTLGVLILWERFREQPAESSAYVPPVATSATQISAPATSVPEPTPAPTQALETYLVQSGDSLLSIAIAYDTTVEVLMALNGLANADQLGAGMVIFVPGETPPAVVENQAPEPAPTSTPAVYSSDNPQVGILAVIGAGDLGTERVVLRQIGDAQVPLAGWSLRTETGDTYLFPQLSLFRGGAVSVHSAAGVDSVVDLYWGRDQAAWQSGAVVNLLDPQGNVHATYTIP